MRSGVGRPDLQRPLDSYGHAQAAALTVLLRRHTSDALSPVQRCDAYRFEPLAAELSVTIEPWAELGPDGFASRIVTACFGDPAFDDAVLCTHGELLSPLLRLEGLRQHAKRQHLTAPRCSRQGPRGVLTIDANGQVTKLSHLRPALR